MSDTLEAVKPETRKIGIFSMGITLVAVGAVMLLAQLGWIDPPGFRWLLPAYFIILGAEALVTRLLLDRKTPDMKLTPAVGSIAITLCVLLFARLWMYLCGIDIPFCFRIYW